MKISLKIILSVLFLAVFAGGGLWYFAKSKAPAQEQVIPVTDNQDQQTSEDQSQELSTEMVARNLDVSTWRTYRNEEYGIEFKYPEEMFDVFQSTEQLNNITLDLFFKVPGNTTRTPIFTFIFYNNLNDEYAAFNKELFSCRDIVAINEKARLCYQKNNANTAQKDYESFITKGICFTHDDRGSNFIVEIPLEQRINQIYITLSCDHSQSLGTVYHSIYQSIKFFPPNTSGK